MNNKEVVNQCLNKLEILELYNQSERIDIQGFDGVVDKATDLVRFISNEKYGSYISYYDFTEHEADKHILQQIEFFKSKKLNFEWKTYSTDNPSNIEPYLIKHGLVKQETESFMVLDLSTINDIDMTALNHSNLVEVTDNVGIRDAIKVQEQVWGDDFEWQFEYLCKLKTQNPESVSIYVVYVDGQPVTSAWLTMSSDSPFAGIWGGSTIETHRGNGYYSLLLNKRILEAKARGKKYLIIDASDMSKPIVEKYGFECLATTTGYVYEYCE